MGSDMRNDPRHITSGITQLRKKRSMSSNELLFALVAFHNCFIERKPLVQALRDWVENPALPFSELLVKRQLLRIEDCKVIDQIVASFQSAEPEKQSIALFSSTSSLHDELSKTLSGNNQFHFFTPEVGFVKSKSAPNRYERETSDSDRFRNLVKHAVGGLGVVYFAEDIQLNRHVAVKKIKEELVGQEPIRQRFNREAELTGQLEHPCIVPIYALGTDSWGEPFYAMKFIRGEDLETNIRHFHQLLREHKVRFNSSQLRQLLRRFIDICNAIEYAHGQGILHRDLKPVNVMLGKFGETLVVDWGLAKSTKRKSDADDSEQRNNATSPTSDAASDSPGAATAYGSVVGSRPYASPEQLKGELDKLSISTDVYSLGAILFQIIVGRAPVQNTDKIENILEEIKSLQKTRLNELQPEIPEPLAYICLKALSFDPKARFASVADLRDGVQCWLDDQAVPGMRESFVAKAGRWFRVHQTLAAAGLVGVVSLALLLGVMYQAKQIQLAQERTHRGETEIFNRELLRNGAKLARDRGQFRQAAKNMQALRSEVSLSEEEELLLVRDLFCAEEVGLAWKEIQLLERSKLSPKGTAEFDLLFGDMQLLTRTDKQGFASIKNAIESELLRPADLAYAKALVADSSTGSQEHFRECLKLDPLNANAFSQHAVTCVLAGDLLEATKYTDFGLLSFPDDVRLLFVAALIPALRSDDVATKKATDRLEEIGGLNAEIEVVLQAKRISELFSKYVSAINQDTLNRGESIITLEMVQVFVDISTILSSQHKHPTKTGLPKTAWIWSLPSSFPTMAEYLMRSLWKKSSNRFVELGKKLPNHQVVQFLLGLAMFSESNFAGAHTAFAQAATCDSFSDSLRCRSSWFALGCLITKAKLAGESLGDSEIVDLAKIIQECRRQDGRYIVSPWTPEQAWNFLVRARLWQSAMDFAQQELATASDVEKAIWQSRIDRFGVFVSSTEAEIDDLVRAKQDPK